MLCFYECHLLCLYNFGAQTQSIQNNVINIKPLQLEKFFPFSKLHDKLFTLKRKAIGSYPPNCLKAIHLTVFVVTFSIRTCLKGLDSYLTTVVGIKGTRLGSLSPHDLTIFCINQTYLATV